MATLKNGFSSLNFFQICFLFLFRFLSAPSKSGEVLKCWTKKKQNRRRIDRKNTKVNSSQSIWFLFLSRQMRRCFYVDVKLYLSIEISFEFKNKSFFPSTTQTVSLCKRDDSILMTFLPIVILAVCKYLRQISATIIFLRRKRNLVTSNCSTFKRNDFPFLAFFSFVQFEKVMERISKTFVDPRK